MSDTSTLDLWAAVDSFVCETLVPPDEVLEETLRASEQAGFPRIHVPANQGKLLHLLARMKGATSILEIGTLAGYSTIWLARALPETGRLVTIEAEKRHADLAEQNIERAGLSSLVDIRVGAASDVLASMVESGDGPFDFIFIDADKPGYPGYLELSLTLSRRGTVIIGDNVIRRGEVPNLESTDERVAGVRAFLEMLGGDSRIDATAVQTVGSKGHDGFALGIVK